MNNRFKNIMVTLIKISPLRRIYDEGLIREIRIIMVNWFFQRILRINGDIPWSVHFTSRVTNPDSIKIGKGVVKSFAVSGNCYIQGGNGIIIGDETIFAPGVKIISANHDYLSDSFTWKNDIPIKIGDHCWIGANAVILPTVELGPRTIVGAGSVVTHSFPGNSIIAGVPAKLLKNINNSNTNETSK